MTHGERLQKLMEASERGASSSGQEAARHIERAIEQPSDPFDLGAAVYEAMLAARPALDAIAIRAVLESAARLVLVLDEGNYLDGDTCPACGVRTGECEYDCAHDQLARALGSDR